MINLDKIDYDVDLSEGLLPLKTLILHLVLLDIMRELKLSTSLLTLCLDVED